MKRRIPSSQILLCGAALVIGTVHAEDITMTDGQVYLNSTLRKSGELIMIKIQVAGGSGSMEMGIPVARIAKVAFPEPPELSKAMVSASKGNATEVLSLTDDYVAKQGGFKELPGSWWPEMARLRVLALAASSKDTDCAELARQMGTIKSPTFESLSRAGTLFSSLASSDLEAVIVGAKALPRIGGDQGSALAQLALGRALMIKKDYPGALRAFLTIKVFYPSVALLQPSALMGAANAYLGLKDEKRAAQSFNEVIKEWPSSPLSVEAKKKAEAYAQP